MLTRNLNESEPPAAQDAPFELRLLGQFELGLRESGALVPVSTAKTRALLAYLAAAPRFTETRRRLAGLLWASSGEDQARQSMRQLLSNFRRGASLGASGIVTFDESNVSLNPSLVAIDRTALMQAGPDADVAELCSVADLYRDDFGQGLDIGEPDFDAWLRTERGRCRDTGIALLDRLVRAPAGHGRHEEALTRANRLAEIDPLREETHRLVIAQEAMVSGRASAMQRYEAFRQLLRDELGVRPEAATLALLDELRRQPAVERPAEAPAAPDTPAATVEPVTRPATRRWRPAAIAAGLTLALALGVMFAKPAWRLFETPIAYIDDNTDRASIVVLPFEVATGRNDLLASARPYEAEARITFARHNRLSMVELPDTAISRDPVEIGRTLRVRYVVKTILTGTPDGMQADVSLIDSATGATVAVLPVPVHGTTIKFAREMVRSVFPELVLHQTRILSAIDPDSTAALLWRASALQISSRVGPTKSEEFALYEQVLARDPKELYALLGLAGGLTLKVARDQSPNRMADIRRAESLMQTAYEEAPNFGEVALGQGMLKKLQQQYDEAIPDFERAVRLDRTQWIAAAQVAHCKMFVGRFEEAYAEMEAVMPNLLPDIGAAESAFIAGETALVTGHPDKAVDYLDIAVSGNPRIARIQALRAAAL
jgi:DNA-binding SARP family transcriptional activator